MIESSKIKIPISFLDTALKEIQTAAISKREGFALWLGQRSGHDSGLVKETYIPDYESGSLFYKITEFGDEQLIKHLKEKKLIVLAQIHSHPNKAFHSRADDELATVNYIGGLSFVVPDFGTNTTVQNFSKNTKVYKLKLGGAWVETNSEAFEVIDE